MRRLNYSVCPKTIWLLMLLRVHDAIFNTLQINLSKNNSSIFFSLTKEDLLTFFNSQIGLSGKKNSPIKFAIGRLRHSQLNWIQVVTAPRRYTNKIPMVRNNWKQVPSVPRIDVSAYSLMKTGQTTHDPPIPIPVYERNLSITHLWILKENNSKKKRYKMTQYQIKGVFCLFFC